MTKISELRERGTKDLQSYQQELARELWKARFGNYTNQLDDTARIRRTRRTIAQINTLLTERELGLVRVSKPTGPKEDREAQAEETPKKKAKAKAAEAEAAEAAADADEGAEEAAPKKKAAKAKPAKATKAKPAKKKKGEE